MLKTWIDNNRVISTSSGGILLWNNRNIKYQGQVVFFKDWIKAEIMYVADIVTSDGIPPYKTICKLIGEAPNRRFYSTMLVTQLSIYFKVILVETP